MLLSLSALFVGLAIVMTFVRAAWISVALLLFFYLFQYQKKRSAVDLIIILMVFTVAGTLMLSLTELGSLFLQRIETISDTKYVANYDRLDRWAAAWSMAMDNIVYGVGWGAYPDQYEEYQVLKGAFSSEIRMGAHNLYLEIFAETGIIGVSVFLFMIFVFFQRCIILQRRIRSEFLTVFIIAMQGAMITYLFHALLNNLGPSDKIAIMFWFLLGMVPTMEYLVERESSAKKTLPN